jgi:hypothetical protein
MKQATPFFSFAFLLAMLSCGSSNVKPATETTAGETKETTPAAPETPTNSGASSGDDITGYWKLSLEAYDDNRNRKLDEDERQKGIKNRYSFRFNADGTCQIMDLYKGRYERKTENGKKLLSVYRARIPEEEEKDPPPDVYEITSMDNGELVLLETLGDHVFWVFKK